MHLWNIFDINNCKVFITKAMYVSGRLKLQFEKCNKAAENNYGGRMTRTPEYVTKMMNAFWFPFPRFPPRRYAGAGAHYHKALICQTPEAVCESGVGISVERRELETQGELNVQAGSERALGRHIHRQFFTRGASRYPATRLTESLRYKCTVSRLSRDGMNLSTGRRYRSSRLRFDPRIQDLLILDPTIHWMSINGKGRSIRAIARVL